MNINNTITKYSNAIKCRQYKNRYELNELTFLHKPYNGDSYRVEPGSFHSQNSIGASSHSAEQGCTSLPNRGVKAIDPGLRKHSRTEQRHLHLVYLENLQASMFALLWV